MSKNSSHFSVMVIVAVFCGLMSFSSVYAQEVIDVTKPLHVKAEDAATARQQMMTDAVETASFESIRSIIGEEKTERSKELIKNKIIRDADKYVLSTRGLNFVKKDGEFAMDVEMKISLKGLRALLLAQGLLYQMEGPPRVLPVIEITDRISGQSFGWWYQPMGKDQKFLSEQLGALHISLRDEMQKIGFYVASPISGKLSQSVPDAYRTENLQKADYLFLGDYFKSSIVLRGELLYKLKPKTENIYQIDVRIEALHSGNGRLMAEVARVYETDPGQFRVMVPKKVQEVSARIAEDLAQQLSDTWKKGTFGASIVRLAVVGPITPRDLEEFKKTIVLQVRDIKSLRERVIEAGKTTFEMDASVLPQQLAQTMATTKFTRFKVEVKGVDAEGLTIKVEAH